MAGDDARVQAESGRGVGVASGLRAKLNALRHSEPAPKPTARAGLIVRVSQSPVDPAIHALDPAGLRRMGWTGGPFDAGKCLFIDTETTGLSGGAGTVAFLVGAGYVEGGRMTVEQYMLRDYSGEPELIDRLAALMERFEYVCSFNGRRFDLPLMESRFTMCRMRHRWRTLENLDLLYPARRAWKLRLGSCRLARIETEILGLERHGDIPGSEVPGRFFEFLKTGDEALIGDVIDHNRQDVMTLATLLVKLCEINARPEALTDPRDLYSMGRTLERQGEWKRAREIYRISAIPRPAGTLAALSTAHVAGLANWRQYHILRRSGDFEGAARVLEQMLQRRQMPGEACVALSKLCEHRFRDIPRALEYAELAKRCPGVRDDIDRRIQRLREKMEA